MMNTNKFKLLLLCIAIVNTVSAQDMWTYFSPDDFARRRAKLMEQIGDGIAILQGAELPEAFVKFRQDNNFYYLTGVEMPGAVLILDGKNKSAMLFVPDKIPGDVKEEAVIKPGNEAAKLYKINRVLSKSQLTAFLQFLESENRPFYLVSSPEEIAEMSRDRSMNTKTIRLNDPLDGRI